MTRRSILNAMLIAILLCPNLLPAQSSTPLFSEVTKRQARLMARQFLEERTIAETFSLPFLAEHEARYQS
ncbi:MAG: hypothetical protein LW694_08950, partial [Chitinophagaceae bacterium]|nr:hypothetical protein [Chitinophagaceae bacterium]